MRICFLMAIIAVLGQRVSGFQTILRNLPTSRLHLSRVGNHGVVQVPRPSWRQINHLPDLGIRALRGGADVQSAKVRLLNDSERAELLQPLLQTGD